MDILLHFILINLNSFLVFYKDWIYGAFYNGTMFSQRVTNLVKGARKKAFVEGRIVVEKVIEEGQMFVEHPILCIPIFSVCTKTHVVPAPARLQRVAKRQWRNYGQKAEKLCCLNRNFLFYNKEEQLNFLYLFL